MELSERCIQTLEKEGFPSVYEVQDAPDSIYPEHTHEGKVSLFLTEGTMLVTMGTEITTLTPGDRLNIPKDTPYSAVVGPYGSQIVVGEMIQGDF